MAVGVGVTAGASCSSDQGPTPAAPADDATLVLGQSVYAEQCARCHGSAGRGGSGPRLAGEVVAAYPDVEDEIALVAGGRRGMPAFGGELSDEEIEAVVRYTREVL